MGTEEQEKRINDIISKLEYVVIVLEKGLKDSLASFHTKVSSGDETFEQLLHLSSSIQGQLAKLAEFKNSKIIPDNTYNKQTLLLESIRDSVEAVVHAQGEMKSNASANKNSIESVLGLLRISDARLTVLENTIQKTKTSSIHTSENSNSESIGKIGENDQKQINKLYYIGIASALLGFILGKLASFFQFQTSAKRLAQVEKALFSSISNFSQTFGSS